MMAPKKPKQEYNTQYTGTDQDLQQVIESYNGGGELINPLRMTIAKGHTGKPYRTGYEDFTSLWNSKLVEGRLSVHVYDQDEIDIDEPSPHFKSEKVPVKVSAVKEHTRTIGKKKVKVTPHKRKR